MYQMFEELLPQNPFKPLEGIYKISLATKFKDELHTLCGRFSPEVRSSWNEFNKVIDFYQKKKPQATLSSVLKAIGVPDKDLAILPSKEEVTVEYWEVTTDPKHIKTMGTSPHFTSCYRGGTQPETILNQASSKGLALVRTMDKKGALKARFIVSADIDVGEGRFASQGRIRASNWKGNGNKYTNVFLALVEGKAKKLEGEELTNFSWDASSVPVP